MKKTLYDIKKGGTAKILEFKSDEIKQTAKKFGLAAGQIVECIEKFGNIVIQKKQQQIAIGKKPAKCILIEVTPDELS